MIKESDVLRMLLAREESYVVSEVHHIQGRLYSLKLDNEHYNAVVLIRSFDYYEKHYHIALSKPTLLVCFLHDTVVPVPVLSLRAGNFAKPYELPEEIYNVEEQRRTKTGARVLLGMYISGVRQAQIIMKKLPATTRSRYLQRVEDLGRHHRGRPVGSQKSSRKDA